METTDGTLLTIGHGTLHLRSCDAETVSDADVAALVRLWRRSYQEQWATTEAPRDDLVEPRIRQGLSAPGSQLWAVFTPEPQTAPAYAVMNQIGQTRAAVSVHVLPEFRRQGIGKTLIRAVAQRMRDTGITSLEAVTTTREPAGQALTARLLGRPITEACVQELPVGDVSHAMLRSWLSRGDEVGVQLETFQGRYDEMDLPSVDRLKAAVRVEYGRVEKDQPPEQFLAKLQQEESRLEGRPDERWVSCARTSSREVVGYNEAILGAELPTLLEETETAVSESMRGRGLGRLIKARLLTDVLESRPSIRLIRTINLTRATGMLKTNEQVGYTVSHHYTRWKIPAESLFEYLVPA